MWLKFVESIELGYTPLFLFTKLSFVGYKALGFRKPVEHAIMDTFTRQACNLWNAEGTLMFECIK